MNIIEVDIAELDMIRFLWEELNEYNNSLHRKCFGERLRRDWAHECQELQKRAQELAVRFHVAKLDEELVGYCLSSINKDLEGEIISLFVRPGFRGKGIGTLLVNEHMRSFRENKARSIFLYVHPCNCDAIRFYWKFNFFSNSPLMELCELRRSCATQ
jgi:diamine N-acetyltransferase